MKNKSAGLHFTSDEEKEFQEMIQFRPKGFSQWMGVKADRVANTIQMFFLLLTFSLISYIFLKPILNQMLFISNTYQLIALPILGIATGLSMMIILRFLFRVLLEIRKLDADRKAEIDLIRQESIEVRQIVEGQSDLMADMEEVVADMHTIASELHDLHIGGREHLKIEKK